MTEAWPNKPAGSSIFVTAELSERSGKEPDMTFAQRIQGVFFEPARTADAAARPKPIAAILTPSLP